MTVTTVILESDDPSPSLIEGVTVRLFDTLGSFVTSATTDPSGEAIVDVPDADYDLYFFKSGISINDGMPQRITVDAADTDIPPNTFKVLAHIATLPEAVDPALCMISGILRGPDGLSSVDGRLVFAPCVEAGYVAGDLLSPKNYFPTAPDATGYYCFTLFRNMDYRVYFTHINTLTGIRSEPFEIIAKVPDLPALHIKDLLYPVPVNAAFSSNALALTVGDDPDNSVDLSVTYSDGSSRTTQPAGTSISLANDNDAVVTVALANNKVVVTPVSAGVANITVTRTLNDSILIFDPTPSFTSETLTVTVT